MAADDNAGVRRRLEVHDLQQGGGLAGAGLADDRHALAGAHVKRDVVHGLHRADAALDQRALCQGELAVQVLHLESDLAVLAGDASVLVLRQDRGGEQRLAVNLAVLDLVAADAGDKVVVGPALVRDQRGLLGQALVDGDGAAVGELAPVRDVDEHRRVPVDVCQRLARRLVHARRGAEQAYRVRHLRVVEQLVDLGSLHRAAAVHDEHIVRGAGHHTHVVGDHDAGCAGFALRGFDDFEDLGLDGHVQRGGRLVRNEHFRVVGDGDGDDHALAHAAGELVGEGTQPLLRLRDAHQVEQLRGAVHRLRLRDVVVRLDGLHELCADVVDGSEGGQRILKNHPDAVATDLGHVGVGLAQQLGAVELHGAGDLGVLRQQAHHREGRDRLARAGFAHDAERAAGVEVEIDATHGADHAGLRGE